MNIKEILKSIGLTNSESKVYLALLKMGLSAKGAILREAKIAPSKIYDNLEKLQEKGLISTIIKNNVKHFAPAPVSRIKEYIAKKKRAIEKQEKAIGKVLKRFEKIQKTHESETKAEVFIGWKGMETVYSGGLEEIRQGEEVYILGASKGKNPEKSKRFFRKYGKRAFLKGIKIKVIFNEDAKSYVREIEKDAQMRYNKKFLSITTPVEIAIFPHRVAIVMLKSEPIIVLIHDRETFESFKAYFNELWKVAHR